MNIAGTRSEKNLQTAFAIEAQASNRYLYYATQARNEGLEEVAVFFDEMAKNEKEHAKVWFKILNNGLGVSTANLMSSAECEHDEWTSLYPEFARIAREENLEMLAIMFENIAKIEKNHENLFMDTLKKLNNETESDNSVKPKQKYVCKNCGNLADERLAVCPICESEDCYAQRNVR